MWHRHPDSGDDAMIPTSWPVTLTRDDLIRLVVGMQWVDSCVWWQSLGAVFDAMGKPGASIVINVDADMAYGLRPAVDIVDEWLGVR
jgi:hypothetical protein